MADRAKCPRCSGGTLTRSEGKLDQCGDTYLPTSVWTCDVCGCARYEPAVAAQWRPFGGGACEEQSAGDAFARLAA